MTHRRTDVNMSGNELDQVQKALVKAIHETACDLRESDNPFEQDLFEMALERQNSALEAVTRAKSELNSYEDNTSASNWSEAFSSGL